MEVRFKGKHDFWTVNSSITHSSSPLNLWWPFCRAVPLCKPCHYHLLESMIPNESLLQTNHYIFKYNNNYITKILEFYNYDCMLDNHHNEIYSNFLYLMNCSISSLLDYYTFWVANFLCQLSWRNQISGFQEIKIESSMHKHEKLKF